MSQAEEDPTDAAVPPSEPSSVPPTVPSPAPSSATTSDEEPRAGLTGTLTIGIFNATEGWTLPDTHVGTIREAAGPELTVWQAKDRRTLIEMLPETDYLFGFPISEAEFTRLGASLQWVQLVTLSADRIVDAPGIMASPVRITTADTIQAPPRAEHAVALTLALLHGLPESFRMQQEHEWANAALATEVQSLQSSTVCIVGMGALGRETAHRFRAFDAKILGVSLNAEVPSQHECDEVYRFEQRMDALERADVVVLAMPASLKRAVILDRATIDALPDHALIVNTSRPWAIDEAAMIAALSDGRLGGAGLDVFVDPQLPSQSALWHMPNVIVTPNLASVSDAYWSRATALLVENLQRLADGRPLIDELKRG